LFSPEEEVVEIVWSFQRKKVFEIILGSSDLLKNNLVAETVLLFFG
jgi:hypothetical protein